DTWPNAALPVGAFRTGCWNILGSSFLPEILEIDKHDIRHTLGKKLQSLLVNKGAAPTSPQFRGRGGSLVPQICKRLYHRLSTFVLLARGLLVKKTEIQPIVNIAFIQECPKRRHVMRVKTGYALHGRFADARVVWIFHDLILQDVHLADVMFLHRLIDLRRHSTKIFSD